MNMIFLYFQLWIWKAINQLFNKLNKILNKNNKYEKKNNEKKMVEEDSLRNKKKTFFTHILLKSLIFA